MMGVGESRYRWNVLVADDEPAARRGVRQLLAPYPDFHVAGECRNGADVLAALDVAPADVVFLDIQMPGIDGFETIRRRTPERMPLIVFLTAYDAHALRAFDAQAFDYLVKPVTEARFAQTIRRLRAHGPARKVSEATVLVPGVRGALVVALEDVEWIEAADNYARLWTGARSHLVRESLRSLELRAKVCGFRRIHRSALVRIGAVKEITAGDGGDAHVVLESGTRVPLARRRRAALLKVLRRQ